MDSQDELLYDSCAAPHSLVYFVMFPLKQRFIMEMMTSLYAALKNELQS